MRYIKFTKFICYSLKSTNPGQFTWSSKKRKTPRNWQMDINKYRITKFTLQENPIADAPIYKNGG